MAEFDPQFQSKDPTYWHWSKASEQPLSDKSTGIALSTIGAGIEGAATLADNTIKGVIKKQLDDEVNSKKDEFITQLDSQLGEAPNSPTRNPLDANAQAGQQDLMPDKPNVPTQVAKGLSTVANIQAAREQGTKFRTTDLDADLTRTLKTMRSQYPGYRDYIDQQGSSIIGYNPANKLISDKISQLNEIQANKAKTQDYWEKQITQSGYDKSGQVLDQFKKDGDVTKVEHWYALNAEADARTQRALRSFQLENASNESKKVKAEQALTTAANDAATRFFMNQREIEGQDNSPTSQDLKKQFDYAVTHPGTMTEEQLRPLAAQYEGLHARNVFSLNAALRSATNKDGESIFSLLGPERYNQIISDTVGGLYNTHQNLLASQDFGLLHATNNAVGDILATSKLKLSTDPSVKNIVQTVNALHSMGGDQMFSPSIMRIINGTMPNIGSDLLKANSVQLMNAAAQTGGANGGPYTLKQASNDVDTAKKNTPVTPAVEAQVYKNFLTFHEALLSKNPALVDNAIKFFYGPANGGSLDRLMGDYYDPSSQKIRTGATAAYETLTQHDITKSIWKRSKEGNNTAWDDYKNWAVGEATNRLRSVAQTWNSNIQENAQEHPFLKRLGINKVEDHHFYYDNETHQMGMMNKKGEIITNNLWYFNPSYFALRNANKYFDGLTRIAHEEGTNPDVLILQALQRAWPADPTSEKIFSAIQQSYNPPKPEEKKE